MDAPDRPEVPEPGPRQLAAHFDANVRRGQLHHLVGHLPPELAPADVRDAFVDHLLCSGPAPSWQHVWNAWVDGHRGRVPVTAMRCEACLGRRIDRRRGTACRTCSGSGRHLHTTHVAVHRAAPPA